MLTLKFAGAKVLLALTLVAVSAAAQSSPLRQPVQVGSWPNGTLDLSAASTAQWSIHDGDNSAWAQPGFDDSAWSTTSLDAQNGDLTGWRWYRIRLHLPAAHPPLALLVTAGDGTWQAWANGSQLPGSVLLPPLLVTNPKTRIIPLNLSGDVELAFRTFVPPSSMFLADRGALRVQIGAPSAIENADRAVFSLRLGSVVLTCAVNFLQILAGIAVLSLFSFQREHREYLWLGIFLVAHALSPPAFLLATFSFVPFSVNWFIADPCLWIATIAQIEFTFSFVGQRVQWPWRIYEALLLAYPAIFLLPSWYGFITRGLFDIGESTLLIPIAVVLLVLLLVWYRRGYREASWLILPSLLPMVSIGLNDIGIFASYFGWKRLIVAGQTIPVGTFPMYTFDASNLIFMLAIGIVMFFRFTRVSQEQARAAAELDAAREIQQYLIPSRLPDTPGLAIQSVYQPSREVGGDFFQVLPLSAGATLIVVGDVAGKGLRAGMLAALIIGAIRMAAKFTTDPAEILALLNERLQGRGLVTCQALRIDADGTAALANAGHIPPYFNGSELAVEGSLPLGAVPAIEFPVLHFSLAPADMLTLISDGVVEAQNPAGELFGFERTAAISTQSANQIAQSAEQFGQEDDITVLTLSRATAAVLPA